MQSAPRIFGSPTRTRILVAIGTLERTYARELARVVEAPLASVQRIVGNLEREGVVATRVVGRQREVELSPRYYARSELQAYLRRLQPSLPKVTNKIEGLRKRPRRAGKEL